VAEDLGDLGPQVFVAEDLEAEALDAEGLVADYFAESTCEAEALESQAFEVQAFEVVLWPVDNVHERFAVLDPTCPNQYLALRTSAICFRPAPQTKQLLSRRAFWVPLVLAQEDNSLLSLRTSVIAVCVTPRQPG